MALQLNTTTSIIDFLKSQNKPSDYTSRKSLYESSGLADRLGPYVSSGSQNIAFLKSLNTPTSTGAVPPAPSTPTLTQAELEAQNASMGRTQFNTETAKVGTRIGSADTAPADTTQDTYGITAADAAASIPKEQSADDILNSVLSSAGFQNFQQQKDLSNELDIGGAQAEKQKLEVKTAADTKAFVDSIGRRGLFFSGETITGLQSLAESLASSKLGVDRKLAGQLLESDLKTKEEIIKQVGQVVKDAQQGRKDAISALEKVGLTVIGNKVVPTLAARNAELSAQREERLIQSTAFNQAATEERLRLAQEAADRATTALQLSIDRAAGGGVVTSGALNLTKEAIGDAASALINSKSLLYDANGNAVGTKETPSQWVDSNLYTKMYQQWTSQGGLGQDFIKAFPPALYVDPNDKSLPTYLQNKPSNNVITISPATIEAALSGE